MLRPHFAVVVLSCLFSLLLSTQTANGQAPQLAARDAGTQQQSAAAASFDQVIDRAVEREHFFIAQMRQLHPLVETYLQNLHEDKDLIRNLLASGALADKYAPKPVPKGWEAVVDAFSDAHVAELLSGKAVHLVTPVRDEVKHKPELAELLGEPPHTFVTHSRGIPIERR